LSIFQDFQWWKVKQLAKLNDDRVSNGLPILISFADITRQWLESIAHFTSAAKSDGNLARYENVPGMHLQQDELHILFERLAVYLKAKALVFIYGPCK
jgi:hypothetical protein